MGASVKGFIYVMSNLSLPGLVKIGYSMKDPHLRAGNDFDPAGLPDDYVVEYHALVDNPREVEQKIHHELKNKHHKKEWFSVESYKAVQTIRSVAIQIYFAEDKTAPPEAKAIIQPQNAVPSWLYDGLDLHVPHTAYYFLHKANITKVLTLMNSSESEIANALRERESFLPFVLELRKDFIKQRDASSLNR